ncbi:hypothetical protein UK82_12685 [Frankia sp. ACN1ag]|nr:hypothetical protein UK82_12685 [Frankia sp. ACN1ag]
MIHSYFDELLLGELLRASIAEEKPCTVLFKIVCPESWPENLSVRARKHFLVLRLGELYALEAARTLRGEALALRHVFEASGSDGVHAYVKEQAESWTASDGNCWEAAMYTAMSKSSWFCDGGFEIG